MLVLPPKSIQNMTTSFYMYYNHFCPEYHNFLPGLLQYPFAKSHTFDVEIFSDFSQPTIQRDPVKHNTDNVILSSKIMCSCVHPSHEMQNTYYMIYNHILDVLCLSLQHFHLSVLTFLPWLSSYSLNIQRTFLFSTFKFILHTS